MGYFNFFFEDSFIWLNETELCIFFFTCSECDTTRQKKKVKFIPTKPEPEVVEAALQHERKERRRNQKEEEHPEGYPLKAWQKEAQFSKEERKKHPREELD